MNSLITIRDNELKGILDNPAQKDTRVLTSAQLAEAYGVDGKTISYNFNHNKERYVEGKHYFFLEGDGLRDFREAHDLPKNINKVFLWTEAGAMLHAKSITNDTAWNVYNLLVDSFFHKRGDVPQLPENTGGVPAETLNRMNEVMETAMRELTTAKEKIEMLEMTALIDMEQQEQIRCLVREITAEKSGAGKSSLIGSIYAGYNRHFHLNSYKNTPKYRFDEAVDFLKNWREK